jgi:anti-sigma regulatory factor (Ser/Thr protein kinase)
MNDASDTPDLPTYVLTEQTHLRMPSKPHWIEATVEWLRQKAILSGACHEARAGKLLVALHEALSNAIVHGNLGLSSALKEQGDDAFARALAERVADVRLASRVVDVIIDCNATFCRWFVTDEGAGFDVKAVLRRHECDDPEVLLASGRGILIMKSFLDEVRWELGGRRLVLALKRLSGEEKRQALRVPRHEPIRVAPILPDGTVDWQAAQEALSRNFSETGVGLLQQGLAQTDRILIGMNVNDKMVYVPAEVRHCRNLTGDVVELGCRLQTEPFGSPAAAGETRRPIAERVGYENFALVQQAITEFLEQYAARRLPADERRRHQRVVYTERIEIITAPAKEPAIGFARDLSKGGMAFVVHEMLPAEVTIVLRSRDDSQSLRVRAEVTRCNKVVENFFDVGVEFLQLEQPTIRG